MGQRGKPATARYIGKDKQVSKLPFRNALADNSKTAYLLPEDVLAEELHDNPKLMRLMFYYMKMSEEELDKEIERLSK